MVYKYDGVFLKVLSFSDGKKQTYGNPYEGRFINMQKNNPYGFTGQRFEPELRMYSFAYRTYNPMSMRWMTPDPIRDGTNWYQYCMSDPVNLWDPLGLENYIRDPLTGSYYSSEWAYVESVERTIPMARFLHSVMFGML